MSGPLAAVATLLKSALAAVAPNPGVCRTALYLGGEVPWDSCGEGSCSGKQNGMLWAKLVGINPTQGGTDGTNCKSYDWTAEIGIVRCITVGNPIPTPAQIQADADRQISDADRIFAALSCCADAYSPLADVVLSSWSPLGPQGVCAGGAWIARGRLDVCC